MIRKAFLFLIHANLLIAFSAALITYATFNQMGVADQWYFIVFVFFTTLFTYNFQRFIRLGLVKKAVPPVVNSHTLSRSGIVTTMGISLMGLLWVLFHLPLRSILLLLPAGVLSFFYAAPVFRYRSVQVALREIPYLKIHMIVLVWVWATVVAPWFSVFTEINENLILLCVERAAFIFALTIPFDIRDLQYDFSFQKTIPQIFGVPATIAISITLSLIFGGIGWLRFIHGYINKPELTAILIVSGLAAIATGATNTRRGELFYTGLLDSLIWLLGILLLVFTL